MARGKRSGSRGKKRVTLKSLSREGLRLDELEAWGKEVSGGTDMACALVIAAHIDHTLRAVILAYLKPLAKDEQEALFESLGAPLTGLHSRILMTAAIAGLDKPYVEILQSIRRIRNEFAHAPRSVDFSNPLISDEVEKVIAPRMPTPMDGVASRAVFVAASLVTLLRLYNLAIEGMRKRPPQPSDDTLWGMITEIGNRLPDEPDTSQ